MEVNIHEAKTHFSKLIERVSQGGEEIIIAKAGVPVARLAPLQPKGKARPLGMDRGKVWIAEDSETLPDDLLEAFYGGELPDVVEPTKKDK